MTQHLGYTHYEPLSLNQLWHRALGQFDYYKVESLRTYNNHFYLSIEHFGVFILLFFYPIYLFFRFIFWAIKTLKQN